jgi:hypothetical protein
LKEGTAILPAVDAPASEHEFSGENIEDELGDLTGEIARMALVEHIASQNMVRPERNIARKRREEMQQQ